MPSDRPSCAICAAPARFLTPGGLMCPTDALLAAIWQPPGVDEWMPALLESDDRHVPAPARVVAGVAV